MSVVGGGSLSVVEVGAAGSTSKRELLDSNVGSSDETQPLALAIAAIQLFDKPANVNTKLFPEKVKENFIITF